MGLSIDGLWRYQTSSHRVSKGPCTECKSSDAFEAYADGHSHCYSCGHHIHPSGQALLEHLRSGGPPAFHEVRLPQDCDYFIPSVPQAWLDKYTLTMPEVRLNRISWSESKQSLIFPVSVNSVLALYQARYFGDDPTQPKWRTIGNKTVLYVPQEYKQFSKIVVVEDLVSAIKVSRVTNCCPLFGSYISSQLVSLIALKYTEAVVWLDPDAHMKSIKTSLALGEAGLKVKTLFGNADPKEYWTGDIREMVNK